MISGFDEFEFDLPEALLAKLIDAFDDLDAAPLDLENVSQLPEAQGIYQLLLDGEIVYIGKTDHKSGLLKRLSRHACKIQHRRNLTIPQVTFKAIRVYVFTAIDLESQLIRHYRGKFAVSWNNSGFGSNDPGRNRDKTAALPNTFDVLYPIDLDHPLQLGRSGEMTVQAALEALRIELPYTLRWDSHAELMDAIITVPARAVTTREVIIQSLNALPSGWQATALAGRVILYKAVDDTYPGQIIGRS